MKRLQPGKTYSPRTDLPFNVIAECIDSETPYIHLKSATYDHIMTLTDVDAQDLIIALKKCLDRLPTSK